MPKLVDSYVSLNGIDLKEDVDFHWSGPTLVLHRPRPKTYQESSLWRRFLGRFFPPPPPPLDFVSVEHWGDAFRATYFSGTPDFDAHVCYEEDLSHATRTKATPTR